MEMSIIYAKPNKNNRPHSQVFLNYPNFSQRHCTRINELLNVLDSYDIK